MSQVIIAEKPMAARKIESVTGVKTIPLVGHLIHLKKQDHFWKPPYFKIGWVPRKNMKQRLEDIKVILSKSTDILVATDYDAEGQLIALNVLRNSNIEPSDVRRMRFSSLEPEELLKSYKHPTEFDVDFAMMAEVRHYLDWYFGINLSKAITILMRKKKLKTFRLTPVGRVQSPVLRHLAERERKIDGFISKKLWFVAVHGVYGELSNNTFEVTTFSSEEKEVAEAFMERNLQGIIVSRETVDYEVTSYPPNTDWVMTFGLGRGISANIIEKILQDLYLNEYISYPRTSSRQYLSHGVDTQRYLERLVGKVDGAEEALGNVPNEGEETDVHPAIYPIKAYHETDLRGVMWNKIADEFVKCHLPPEQKSYETCTVSIGDDVHRSKEIPDLEVEEVFDLTYNLREGKIAPPRRYKQIDVYEWMTGSSIGTRDTRSRIVTKVLQSYAYETKGGIYISGLGMKIVKVLEKFSPELMRVNLTRKFERQIAEVGKGGSPEAVLAEGREVVTELIRNIFSHSAEIQGML